MFKTKQIDILNTFILLYAVDFLFCLNELHSNSVNRESECKVIYFFIYYA